MLRAASATALCCGRGGGLPSRRQQRFANQFGSRFVELFEQSFDRLQRRCRVAGPGRHVAGDLQQHVLVRRPGLDLARCVHHVGRQGCFLGGRLGLGETIRKQLARRLLGRLLSLRVRDGRLRLGRQFACRGDAGHHQNGLHEDHESTAWA